ncbi:hypothetical protein DFH09DRAFT_1103166 [Mycena vulgaris]|nr:hypothetical protein DFH09DRAFT_1103166 [Mycena vulgaris]
MCERGCTEFKKMDAHRGRAHRCRACPFRVEESAAEGGIENRAGVALNNDDDEAREEADYWTVTKRRRGRAWQRVRNASSVRTRATPRTLHRAREGWGKWLNSEPAMLLERESLGSPNRETRERPTVGGGKPREDAEGTPKPAECALSARVNATDRARGGTGRASGPPGTPRERAAGRRGGTATTGETTTGEATTGEATTGVTEVRRRDEGITRRPIDEGAAPRRGDEMEVGRAGDEAGVTRRDDKEEAARRGDEVEGARRVEEGAGTQMVGRQVAQDGEGLVDVQLPCVGLPPPEELDLLRRVTSLRSGESGPSSKAVTRKLAGRVPGPAEAVVKSAERIGAGKGGACGGDEKRCKRRGCGMGVAINPVTQYGAGRSPRSGTDESTGSLSPDVGLACLDVAEQGVVGDNGDARLREIDGGVEASAVSDGELPATHERGPGERERRCEHPAVVVVRELCKDVRENFTGDSAADSTGLGPVAPFRSGDETLENGVVKSVEGPSVLRVDGTETGEIL